MALPVPRENGSDKLKGGTGWLVLPGAPRCYAMRRFEHFHPTSRIKEWCERHADIETGVAAKIQRYFADEQGSHISGFMSQPLYEPTEDFVPDEQRRVVGVLNVDWSNAQRLNQQGPAEKFTQAIYPMQMLLAQQVARLIDSHGLPEPHDATGTNH